MDKKILSAAVAGVLAGSMAFAANADVTVFGKLNMSIDSVDVDGGSDDINMNCTTCSVGFKGSEDLGNGLKAVFLIDFQYDGSERNANGALTDRDQWVGLAGEGWGSVKFGTISTGYKSTGAMIDPLYRTSAQARGLGFQSSLHLGAGENGQGRMTNHVRYDSPSMSGFKVIVDYSFDSEDVTTRDDDAWGLTGVYKNGPILGFVSYLTNDHGGEDDAWKIGGSYQINDEAKVFAQYENDGGLISSTTELAAGAASNTTKDADVWHIGATYTMGSNMLYAAYGQGDDNNTSGATNTAEYDTWTIAVAHMFSKRTFVYGGYNNIDCDGTTGNVCGSRTRAGEQDVITIGLQHNF
ncbi:porin [Thiohalobacter sp. IOR34]|uniref:porin n=1 Tax=Thiohalobacter sp. IOR34 TaxID=3057176 RepID=UPI0025B11277|nr:porin [Thiohalobacter sp. IOR34]WJW75857.1 porin [Thiohalobacter sp. IOR34]